VFERRILQNPKLATEHVRKKPVKLHSWTV